jgi:hypothetical protein
VFAVPALVTFKVVGPGVCVHGNRVVEPHGETLDAQLVPSTIRKFVVGFMAAPTWTRTRMHSRIVLQTNLVCTT